jgi:predicted molibdopterin-dependent oxidoreductase YjgC
MLLESFSGHQYLHIQYESFLYLEQVKRDQKLIYTVAGRKKRGGVSDTLIADVVCTFDGVGCTFNVVDSTADVVDFIQ